MAQKVVGYVKLQIPAGKATPAPPVGPALGQHGVNIAAFTKERRLSRAQIDEIQDMIDRFREEAENDD